MPFGQFQWIHSRLARGISLFNIGRQPKATQVKNTNRDGSSTALYTDHTIYNVYTVYTT